VRWENVTLRIQLWDTAGQEIYRSITQTYYRGSDCAFVVYDITDFETFTGVDSWIDQVKKICPPHCLIVIVGNKLDFARRRAVTATQVNEVTSRHGVLAFEASAKTGENVMEVFRQSIVAVLDIRDKRQREEAARELTPAHGKGCC
jgi:small GTP-binding protein